MPVEIERKFLVRDSSWKENAFGVDYRQGYILTQRKIAVRVRVAGDKAFLTIKGRADKDSPLSRAEFEYPIPLLDAVSMLDTLCEPQQIVKVRYKIPFKGHVWEVDEFLGDNLGLVVAEIELASEDEAFARPDWLGGEVSLDPRYSNTSLAMCPFSTWE